MRATRLVLLALVALALFAAPANAATATLLKTNCSPVASNAAGELFFNERQPSGLFDARVGDMNCQNGKPLLPPYNGHRGVADVAGNLVLLETGTPASWSEPGRGFGMQLQLLHRDTGRVDQLTTGRKGIIWAKLHPSGTKVTWAEMVKTPFEANWWHNLLGVWSVHVADIVDGRLVNERSWQHPTDPGFVENYGWLDNDTIMFASDSGVQASTPWVGDWFAAQLWTMPDTLEGQPTRVSRPFTIKEWGWATWSLVDRSVNPYHEFMHIIDGWLYFSVVWEYDLTGVGYDSPAVYNGLDLWRMRPDGTQRERVTALNTKRFAHVGALAPDRTQPGRIVAGVCNNITCDGSIDAYEVNVGGNYGANFPALLKAPEGTGAPAITGGNQVGDELTCSQGSWAADLPGAFLYRAPASYEYQWLLDGNEIPGQTAPTFTPEGPGDYTCTVKATNGAGNDSQTSAAFNVPAQATLDIEKFYDANANGQFDAAESTIADWKVQVDDTAYLTPQSLTLDPGDYRVTESDPVQTNWRHTTAGSVQVSLNAGDEATVEFGNVCLGAGGALSTGFWSSKKGQSQTLFNNAGQNTQPITDLQLMQGLHLRNANGTDFNPADHAAFKSWLGKATATNMAYMLSAQLAAMELSVLNGKVDGDSLIYAPGTESVNDLEFATVNDVMSEADGDLGLHGLTKSGSPFRADQTALKDALYKAIANLTFVQGSPCRFTFAQ